MDIPAATPAIPKVDPVIPEIPAKTPAAPGAKFSARQFIPLAAAATVIFGAFYLLRRKKKNSQETAQAMAFAQEPPREQSSPAPAPEINGLPTIIF
ncbi:MAG: hypothetical protein NDJ89_09635 [Oligoflexia bacterium]|nr:hypothetical protein [Oligoflexia bacterium]